jgi:DNA-directed RNA polymerase subunit alpha
MQLSTNNLKVQEIINENDPYSSSFVFRYLPSNMGITLGNLLKRASECYIRGTAAFAVKIADKNGSVTNTFTTLSGVDKVTRFLIAILKEIIFEAKEDKKGIFCLELNVENKENKERVVTAADFQEIEGVKIKNPNLKLATLAATSSELGNSKLEIKLYCRKDWDYHRAEEQEESEWWKDYFNQNPEENVIALDTNYSPIKGREVNFKIEAEVVGLNDKKEKLIVDIKTNGTISPKNCLLEALKVCQNSLNDLTNSLINNKII